MKKLFKKRSKQEIPSRITNETVAEHRERILAGGRRFKYPMQYARHRLVINTVIISVIAVILIVVIGWWQLYPAQNTSNFAYRVTRVLPLPVASVDGEPVRYSDYLMYYNSSIHYLTQNEQLDVKTEDGKRQVDYVKRKSMDTVIADTYARKLARQLGITVSDKQVDAVISDDRNTANGRISQETYDASALSVLGWTPSEYRQDAKNKLVRQAVAFAIDSQAKQRQAEAAKLLQAKDPDFDKIAAQLGGTGDSKVVTGVSGFVPTTNRDGGLSTAATKLEKGEISGVIKSTTGDGYYFIRLLDKNDAQVNYEYLQIPLTEFNDRLAKLKKDGKVHEYISIKAATEP
ncbi:MAG TPA: SurA N-terminal domain-containing protein [Candidatus Saccharimonadaceae bacterium]|nr:SurA N-terminal domain-containing protein [Candidatus Saccharimonadaceae bacterium]